MPDNGAPTIDVYDAFFCVGPYGPCSYLLLIASLSCCRLHLGNLSVWTSAETCASARTVSDVKAGRDEARRASQNTMDDTASGHMNTCLSSASSFSLVRTELTAPACQKLSAVKPLLEHRALMSQPPCRIIDFSL